MKGEVDTPFLFETEFEGQRHPHYGRFLRLKPNRLVEITWVTGADGTEGAETVVTIDITSTDDVCRLTLVHVMDPKWAEYADRTREGWSFMLDKLDTRLTGTSKK